MTDVCIIVELSNETTSAVPMHVVSNRTVTCVSFWLGTY